MSVVTSARNSIPGPTVSLQTALNLFKDELTQEQKLSFFQSSRTLTPSDVIVFIAEIDAANQTSRRSFSSRLYTFLDAVQQFAGVVDTFVSSNPAIAALIWGSIKASLVIANNYSGYFEKVTTMITSIGKLSPTYSEFGKLYPNDCKVQAALCEYYAVVVRICTTVVKRSTVVSRILSSFDSHFKSLLEELEKEQRRLHLCLHLASQKLMSESAQKIDTEQKANKLYRQLAARFQSSSLQEHTRTRTQLMAQHRWRVLDNLSTIKPRQIWSQIQAQRVSRTAEWFVQDLSFKFWHQSTRSSVLCCSGSMGAGKSVLMSSIVAYLEKEYVTDSCIAYHFCRVGYEDTLTVRGVLGSIARQLLTVVIDQFEDDQLRKLLDLSRDMSVQDIVDILVQSFEMSLPRSYFIVVDGLDECSESSIIGIISQLKRVTENAMFCIRLLYSCRSDLEETMSRHIKYDAKLIINTDNTEDDIETFIEVGLQQCIDDGRLQVTDTTLSRIVRVMEVNHDGMFLWLALFIEELCDQNHEADIINSLDHPPTGIKELYSRKLLRIQSHKLAKTCLDILGFTGVARRPLKIEEMREALSVEPDQREFDVKRMPDMNRIIRACGGLLHVDEGTDSLYYIHSSLHSYLSSESEGEAEYLNYDEARLRFGSICLTYLNFQNFTKQVIKAPSAKLQIEPVDLVLTQFPHSRGFSSKLTQKLLRSRSSGASADLQLLHSMLPRQQSGHTLHFEFFKFASENWLQQIRTLVPIEDSAFWTRLHRCIEDRELDHFKPWLTVDETQTQHSSADKITQWALENKHNALLFYLVVSKHLYEQGSSFEMVCLKAHGMKKCVSDVLIASLYESKFHDFRTLVASGVDTNVTGSSGETLMHAASRMGHLEVVKELVRSGADVNAHCDNYGWTALYIASRRGHLKVVKELITRGADVNTRCDDSGWTALLIASQYGHLEVVKELITRGADVNARCNNGGWTALYVASRCGYLKVVKELVRSGADVNTRYGNHGWTALHIASEYGHLEVVKELVTCSADVNAHCDNHGWTALYTASRGGHLEVVKELVARGADVNTRCGNNNWTALYVASREGHLEVVKELVTRGADVNARCSDSGWTAQDIARQSKKTEVEEFLKQHQERILQERGPSKK